MRRDRVCRLGGWLLWGSLGALVGVIGLLLVAPVAAASSEDAGEIMLSIVKGGFLVMFGAFLLGISCHLLEGLAARGG